jgi:methionyl-tRNA synthetase
VESRGRYKSGKITELKEVMVRWIDGTHRVAIDLHPFLPETSQKMIDALNTRPIQAATLLFPRIE